MSGEDFIAEFRRLRERIDDVDLRVVEIVCERLELAAEIGACKRAAGRPVVDPERECAIRGRVRTAAAGRLTRGEIDRLYEVLLLLARARAAGTPV